MAAEVLEGVEAVLAEPVAYLEYWVFDGFTRRRRISLVHIMPRWREWEGRAACGLVVPMRTATWLYEDVGEMVCRRCRAVSGVWADG